MNVDHLKSVLADAEARVVEELRRAPGNQEALDRKRQLDWARRVLEQARRLALIGKEQSWELPPTLTQTPSSEFRVVEDHESDDRNYWTEVVIGGPKLRLAPGDVVLRRDA